MLLSAPANLMALVSSGTWNWMLRHLLSMGFVYALLSVVRLIFGQYSAEYCFIFFVDRPT